jgi:NTP pyrophosphatase (non-canonical NTP hydrolase)
MEEMRERQRAFDNEHGWDWETIDDVDEKFRKLQYLIIALTEETGEIAGPVKKFLRKRWDDDWTDDDFDELKEQIREEVTDVQIYLMLLADLLDLDLDAEHQAKLDELWERFAEYRK